MEIWQRESERETEEALGLQDLLLVIAFVRARKPLPRRDKWIGERIQARIKHNNWCNTNNSRSPAPSIFDTKRFEIKIWQINLFKELLDPLNDHFHRYSPTNKSQEPQRKQYRSVNQYRLSPSLLSILLSSHIHGRREQLPRVVTTDVHVSSIEEETLSGSNREIEPPPPPPPTPSPLPRVSIRFQTYLHPYETE